MIIDAIITFLISVWNALMSIFPVSQGFPASVDSAVAYCATVIHMFDAIIPSTALFDAILLILLVRLSIATVIFLRIFFGFILRGQILW
jgi:hypothetical protein